MGVTKQYQLDLVDTNLKYKHGTKQYAISAVATLSSDFKNDFKSTGSIAAGDSNSFFTTGNSLTNALYTSIQVIVPVISGGGSLVAILEGSNVGGTDATLWDTIQTSASLSAAGSLFLSPGYSTDTGRKLYAFYRVKLTTTTAAIADVYVVAFGHE